MDITRFLGTGKKLTYTAGYAIKLTLSQNVLTLWAIILNQLALSVRLPPLAVCLSQSVGFFVASLPFIPVI
jgi:hypothetical protein